LILLSEYWRWSADDDLVRSLRDNVRAALDWIDNYGDRDGDGYVEYQTRSPQGLGNQCWRDSWDGVQFADGTLPVLPIATCEILSPERAAIVARQLMSDELFSGWGVRTLSTADKGFNPIGYHLGTVWPHDTSIIALGLSRYGFRAEANRITLALLDAAATSGY